MPVSPVVIIGAGHAGVRLAAALRTASPPPNIILLDQDEAFPYERPPLSKEILKDGPEASVRLYKDEFYAEQGINLMRGCAATRINRRLRTVELADGRQIPYSRVVVATGARARKLPVPGASLNNVYMLRTLADAQDIHRGISQSMRVVVVGGGYIGLEVAAAAAAAGRDVTIIEAQDRLMKRVTGEHVSRHFEYLHRLHNVKILLQTGVAELRGADSVERVIAQDGSAHPADLVVVGIGVQPNDEIARASGLACEDGVLVNAQFRTEDPDVYAIGDVARSPNEEGTGSLRLESVQNASAQALAVADDILGIRSVKHEVPWFWTTQYGVRLQTAGLLHGHDQAVVRGSMESGRFAVLYLKENRLIAIDNVGTLKDFMIGKKLIASRAILDIEKAVEPDIKLADTVTVFDETHAHLQGGSVK
jgi:3-phenylpropionate/trans-cinnamate dioxygenase ferredoxin reductase subunit